MDVFSSLLRRPKNKSPRHLRAPPGYSHDPSPSPSFRDHSPYLDNPNERDETRCSYLSDEDDGNTFDQQQQQQHSEEDGPDSGEATPLLPIFSSAHLDALPVYNLTHSIRTLIVQRCETTLSWDQLRSPQISQFLVKPIQQQIRLSHFSRATLYSLIANCLQFHKEGQVTPGNVGVCRTRALMSELLAVRLLREFSTRELIDALSYDFDPLQGMVSSSALGRYPHRSSDARDASFRSLSARTSTLEVAIRAQAKRFLAHPLVVQHLEAIWAGAVVFHSAADSLHRLPSKPASSRDRHIGATHQPGHSNVSQEQPNRRTSGEMIRRSVSLYNPSDASPFKLSRLRVPRYRQIFSTLSYAIMLGLFLAVLVDRSLDITALEVVFWFWGAGFMLDEIVGFSEQGFGLYIMSVWNTFDIGILLFFIVYYILRLYGIIMVDEQKLWVADMAYDTLAATAVLLFPRLFSLLDHYRYFSQLLIAFRLMMQDLAAILILIAITCSGFFVAFTLSFGRDIYDGAGVVYALFQILMGFTPAAWQAWGDYNILGKIILTLFLIICHFLVVTILITVLTNSFMTIVKNANEEHQFLFAVNVLSMVKSDALFSYIAPSNIIGWVFSPVRYVMPFRQFVRINRTVIKLTHFPILFIIFAYERLYLSNFAYEPIELVRRGGIERTRLLTFALGNGPDQFAPSLRLREPSLTTRHKDRALEEVFRQPYKDATVKQGPASPDDRPISAVDSWMNNMGGIASPPIEQPPSVLEQLEVRRPRQYRSVTSLAISTKHRAASRSAMSNLDDRIARTAPLPLHAIQKPGDLITLESLDIPKAMGDNGDNEIVLNNGNDGTRNIEDKRELGDIFAPEKPIVRRKPDVGQMAENQSYCVQKSPSDASVPFVRGHDRQTSVNTIVFKPIEEGEYSSASSARGSPKRRQTQKRPKSGLAYAVSGLQSGRQTPKRSRLAGVVASRPRPVLPARTLFKSSPNITRFQALQSRRRYPSYETVALDLASDIGDNRHIGVDDPNQSYGGLVSGSFNTQMDFAASMRRKQRRERHYQAEESQMMSRMVLARMNALEEGFKDILKEVKEWRNSSSRVATD